jgi:predicted RecB family nuclease
MFLRDDTVIYSASDLAAAASCEWALMRKLDGQLGRIPRAAKSEDDMLKRAGRLGTAHELATLARLKETREVVEFAQGDFGDFEQGAADTLEALKGDVNVLYQATFFDGRLLGYADFIMKNDAGVYEVYDTKLARKAKITALLQLAAYADQLTRLGIPIGDDVHVILGDGRTSSHQLRDILPVYLKRRERLQAILDERMLDTGESPWGDPRYTACGRCDACSEQVELHRDVLLVAGMKLTQRSLLNVAGVLTIDDLAVRTARVDKLSDTTLASLREQAALQIEHTVDGKPAVHVYNAAALAAIPEPDDGDIFFDFEGDPLYSESGGPEWGIDYLFGLVETDGTFRPFWAHNYAEEKQALIDFLAYATERRQRHPNMHIYHYASYERTHLLSLAARHSVGEDAVDDLLRENVLVDLYPIVRKAVRVGSHSYSIKKLEPLYMGDEHREGVSNAADSITEYADARELIDSGDPASVAQGEAKLDAIGSYNEYDCVSTLKLRDWMLGLAASARVTPARGEQLLLDYVAREPSPAYLALAAHIEDVEPGDRTADNTAIALASAAIDYHRREAKKFWQDHFARLVEPFDDWADTRNVLLIEGGTVEREWYREGGQRSDRRILRLWGALAPGSSIKPDNQPYLVYEDPQPDIALTRSPGARASRQATVLASVEEHSVEEYGRTYFIVEETLEKGADRYFQLPRALAPAAPPRASPQPEAIEEWGGKVLDALPEMLADPALDILRRQPPRGAVAPVVEGDTIAAIVRSLLSLDHSYLAVQGPPGTGKTYTGSHVITELVVKHGWKVGVVAQGHANVENMLEAIVKAGLDPDLIGKRPKDRDGPDVPWKVLTPPQVASFTAQSGGWVLGGTAWTFSNPTAVPRETLDVLVIDEAGQFSLASTIASAVSAKRVLLLGDPQQLPQVSQGAHPEPVDESALGWLSEGHDVLPAEFGYFLERSWRMHPALCAPVSRLSYEGKLESRAGTRMLVGADPGLHPVAVAHSGNSTQSAEEAARVVQIVRDHLGNAWTDRGETRPLDQSDIIVVAPYNAQVELIRLRLAEAGFGNVPVGTVDKFQGREAPIAIVSMSASSAVDVPRGLEFLLLANRLNVAISRAQWAAYLLYSPALLDALPTSAAGLAQLSAFIELVEG